MTCRHLRGFRATLGLPLIISAPMRVDLTAPSVNKVVSCSVATTSGVRTMDRVLGQGFLGLPGCEICFLPTPIRGEGMVGYAFTGSVKTTGGVAMFARTRECPATVVGGALNVRSASTFTHGTPPPRNCVCFAPRRRSGRFPLLSVAFRRVRKGCYNSLSSRLPRLVRGCASHTGKSEFLGEYFPVLEETTPPFRSRTLRPGRGRRRV